MDVKQESIINPVKQGHRRYSVDGFIKDSSKTVASHKKVISGEVHRRTEKAKTLMRSGLKRPVAKNEPHVSRVTGRNPERELRAKATPKHHGVNRFGMPSPRVKSTGVPKAMSGELISKPAVSAKAQISAAAPLPSMITSVSHQKLERMLDQALTHADSHKQAVRYHAARHFWQRRWLGHKWLLAGVILIVLAAGLLVSWQKVPAISVKAAGMKAHVHPSVPAYIPDGYKMAGPAKADSGTVAIKYISPADDSKSYEIVQAQSNLTSQLVQQSVVPKGAPVQTSQVEGNTVYIYGHSNDAAWVNNGVLYTIKDNAGLSSDELIKIVQGLN